MEPNAYNWTHADWKRWMKGVGEPVFRADQVMDWLYVKRVSSFAEMTNLFLVGCGSGWIGISN